MMSEASCNSDFIITLIIPILCLNNILSVQHPPNFQKKLWFLLQSWRHGQTGEAANSGLGFRDELDAAEHVGGGAIFGVLQIFWPQHFVGHFF
jgi:hypothetical protein